MARDASLVAMLIPAILILVGVTVGLRTVFLQPIHPARCIVQVWEEESETGVADVRVKFDLVTWPYKKDVIDYEVSTDWSGVAETKISPGDYYIILEKPGYETLEAGPYQLDPGDNRLNFHLAKGGAGEGHTCKIYFRTSDKRQALTGWMEIEGKSYAADESGMVVIYHLPAGPHNARFRGEYRAQPGAWPSHYDFQTTFTMPSRDASYTVWVDTGFMEGGHPGEPPRPSMKAWIIGSVLVGGVLLFGLVYYGHGPYQTYKAIKGRS